MFQVLDIPKMKLLERSHLFESSSYLWKPILQYNFASALLPFTPITSLIWLYYNWDPEWFSLNFFRFRCQEKRGEILDQRLDRMGWMLHSLPGSSQDKIIPIPRPLFVYLRRRRCFQRTHFSGCHMASSVKSPLLLLLCSWTFFDGDGLLFFTWDGFLQVT